MGVSMTRERFVGQTVVVTGASLGIGAAAARRFAAEGARVVLAARGADALRAVAAAIGGDDRALPIPTDVTDTEHAAALLERAERHFGAVHVLVNNAGYNSRGAIESRAVDEITRIVDVNLRAPIVLTRLALPYLRRAGGGAIVNVASLAGRVPLPDEATYSATKFGLRAFSFALAEELRGSGITISVVSPGPVDTGFIMDDLEKVPDVVFSQPMSTPEQVAGIVLDCAHDGRRERAVPRSSGYLTTLGYLMPRLPRLLKPLLERRGRAEKRRYRSRQQQSR